LGFGKNGHKGTDFSGNSQAEGGNNFLQSGLASR